MEGKQSSHWGSLYLEAEKCEGFQVYLFIYLFIIHMCIQWDFKSLKEKIDFRSRVGAHVLEEKNLWVMSGWYVTLL
jgi:hypothetical protein